MIEVAPRPGRPRPHGAVLFDRDGTLVVDVPYNADPDRVVPVPDAVEAIRRVRRAGLAVGLVTNQSVVGCGRAGPEDVAATNRRLARLVGPFDVVAVCPHVAAHGCDCRKPAPGLILEAAAALDLEPSACVVIGDIGADVDAAAAAGATGLLVPTPATRSDEVRRAVRVARDLLAATEIAVDLLGPRRAPTRLPSRAPR